MPSIRPSETPLALDFVVKTPTRMIWSHYEDYLEDGPWKVCYDAVAEGKSQSVWDSKSQLSRTFDLVLSIFVKTTPEQWTSLSALTHLSLAFSCLSTLPEALGMVSCLLLPGLLPLNFLELLLASATQLVELDLRWNDLTELPDFLSIFLSFSLYLSLSHLSLHFLFQPPLLTWRN